MDGPCLASAAVPPCLLLLPLPILVTWILQGVRGGEIQFKAGSLDYDITNQEEASGGRSMEDCGHAPRGENL